MNIYILSDERAIETIGKCENCHKTKCGRTIEAYGIVGESRGVYFICFDCFKPRIEWRPIGKYSHSIFSPVEKIR